MGLVTAEEFRKAREVADSLEEAEAKRRQEKEVNWPRVVNDRWQQLRLFFMSTGVQGIFAFSWKEHQGCDVFSLVGTGFIFDLKHASSLRPTCENIPLPGEMLKTRLLSLTAAGCTLPIALVCHYCMFRYVQ